MRSITKRLTCVNRGETSANQAAMDKIIKRYLAKMEKKGWRVDGPQFSGDKFMKWEHIITLVKS